MSDQGMVAVASGDLSAAVQQLPHLKEPGKKVALVLSGGAAKGDFEVGVTQYLYWRAKVDPAIICGTSVGAMNAAKLAEGEDPNNEEQGLRGLTGLWRSLHHNSDMWLPEPVFQRIGNDIKSAAEAAIGTGVAATLFGPLGLLIGAAASSGDFSQVSKDASAVLKARSMANLNPIAAKIRQTSNFDPAKVKASNKALRLVAVALGDGQLRYVDEDGRLHERDGSNTTKTMPDPACAGPLQQRINALQDEYNKLAAQDNADVNHDSPKPGQDPELRMLRDEIEQLRQELSQCPGEKKNVVVGLVEAVLASSSLPFFFPPVNLGDDWYVDGGVRSVCPIETAVGAGAEVVYAVVAGSAVMGAGSSVLTQAPLPDFAPGDADFLDIGMRVAADIEPDENVHRDLEPPLGWGVPTIVVRPGGSDIHNGMTIDPGLIDIRIDQGWMRADDTVQAYAQDPKNYATIAQRHAHKRNTGALTRLRYQAWKQEFAALGWHLIFDAGGTLQHPSPRSGGADQSSLDQLRGIKRKIKQAIDERRSAGGELPLNADHWWQSFERHWFPQDLGIKVDLWDASHPAPH